MQKESQQARPWSEVASSEQFRALPAEHQERARELYFQDTVLPRVPQGMEQRARELFDNDTLGAAVAQAPAAANEPDGIEAMDFAKEVGAGALIGTGSLVSGLGDAVRPDPQARQPIMTPNGEFMPLGDLIGKHVIDPVRGAVAGAIDGPASAAGEWLGGKGKALAETKSEAAKQALQASMPTGDITSPSTWSMGEDPSLAGYGLHAANLAGQFAPQVGAIAATRGRSVQTPAMMAVGGLQAGGAAANEVVERIAATPDGDLQASSTLYRQLRQSMGEQEARRSLAVAARNAAFGGAAPVGALGGLATQVALGPLQGAIGGSVGRQLAGSLLVEAPGEGAQEVAEVIEARRATNRALGEQRSLTENTFADFALGAMGGAGFSAAGTAINAAGGARQSSRPGPGLDLGALLDEEVERAELSGDPEQIARQSLDPANAQIQAGQARPEVAGLQAVPGAGTQQPAEAAAPEAVAPVATQPVAPQEVVQPAGQSVGSEAAQSAAAPAELSDNGTGVFRVPVDQIKVDPRAYQFRGKVDDKGTDKRLDAVTKWDDRRSGSVVLHRRADGSLYVADGHHRVALARRLSQPAINAVILDEASGIDVPAARREAAMINIAGGNADALDVAKVFRDSGLPAAEVRAANNLPTNQATADGQALAALGDNVFGMVTSGQLDEKSGAAIGAGFTDPGQQEEAARVFQKIQPATAYQRELLIQEIRSADFAAQQGEQSSLFGDDEQQVSLLQHRLTVLDKLRQGLNADKRLFTSLNDNADRAAQAGNTIATEANAQITEASKKSLDMLGRVTTTPALNEMVNRASRRIAGGEPVAAVVRELKKEMIGYGQDATGARGAYSAGGQQADRAGDVAGAGQRVPARDADGAGNPRESGSAREGSGPAIQQAEDFQLGQQTEETLQAEEAARKSAADAEAASAVSAEQRAQADAEVGDFTLTGSDRSADVAAARGQNDLFAADQQQAAPPSVAEQLASMDPDALASLIDEVSTETAAPQTSKPKAQRSSKAKTKSGKKTVRKVATKAELADITSEAEVSRAAGEIAKSLGVNMSSAGMNALEGLTKLFGGPGRLNSGLSFDEETYAKAKPHFSAAMADIQAAGKDLRDFIRALVGQFGDGVKPYILRYAQDLKQEQDGERTNRNLEQDRPADAEQGPGQDLLDDQPGEGGRGVEQLGAEQGEQRADAAGGIRGDRAAAAGERGDQQLDGQESAVGRSDAGSADGGRGRPTSTGGLHAERSGDGAADRAPARAVAPAPAKVEASDKPATLTEIKAQLPFLTDGQAEDVVFAERRLMQPEGYGVLYTNGTGTGKTFTGLGVMSRSVARGKGNILVVAPKQTIVDAWVKAGQKFFGLDIKTLSSTQDNGGAGIVATTYANLAANNSLALRDWDMVVADEAHYLSSAEDGGSTTALQNLRALARRRGYHRVLVNMQNPDLVQRAAELMKDGKEKEAAPIFREIEAMADAMKERWSSEHPEDKTRAVFLSATPFAYEKNVGWAQQFLFDWGDGEQDMARGYNSGGDFERFMMQHFGYRMRYNKLTAPDANVDSGLMQRAFNSWLKREGVLSGRALDSDFDYDRLFVTIDSHIGRRVDDALKWLSDMTRSKDADGKELHASEAQRQAFGNLHTRIAKDSFNYNARMYFLEAIKAREALPHIRAQLAAGRKVLVMHDFKKGGAVNPFRQSFTAADDQAAYEVFKAEFPDLVRAFDVLPSPIDQLSSAFPDALIYNGSYSAKQRLAMQNDFNSDADDSPRVIIAQGDAMREGVSIHDTTGKFPRVMVHLGMPVKPTAAIQQEGRIYRTGQASHAMFRYFTIGTSWERSAFAGKIATRASAAENLAMGEQARGLKQAFISAYENADLYEPGFDGEGAGGKASDREAAAALTPWDMAKSFYFGTKKQGAGRSARGREGTDYFATPEPVGLKMVEWADIRGGDSVLEPSAGHGAIARWFPENARVRVIEQSAELASRVALHIDGDVVQGNFEDHNIVNKYDAIVMNPPYGLGGSVAIPHLAKAADHLRDGGRVVALIPTGPAADKKFDNWFYGQDKNGKPLHPDLHLVGDVKMPGVTFERAGTSVATRIVVIEKMAADLAQDFAARQSDLSNIEDIGQLFERMEGMEMRARAKPVESEAAEQTAPTRSVEPKRSYAEIKAEQTGRYTTDAPIVEHVTKGGKGKTLRGVIVRDMTLDEVKAKYNEYAFRKDGGVFLREEFVQRAVQEQALSPEEARFSRAGLSPASVVTGSAPANPISLAEAEAAAQEFLADYNGNIPLTYRIRKTQRELYGPQGDVDRLGFVKGAYHPGRGVFTLAADHLSSMGDAREVLRHEILGHYGLDTFKPADKQALLERILASKSEPSLLEAWGRIAGRYDDKSDIAQAEEVFAYLAEQDRSRALQAVDFLRAALVRLLRSVGYKRKVVTRAELLREVEAISKGIRNGQRSYQGAADGGTRYSLFDPAPPAGARPEQGRLDADAEQDGQGVELPGETAARKAQRLVQDKLNRFTVIREWLAERGVDLSEDADVYKAEERMHSRFSNKAKDFREGTVQPLVEKIQKAGFGMDEAAQYLHAQHAQERNAQIARINRQMPDGGSGMSNSEARAILAAADPKLVRLANELRAITDRTRQVLLDSGLIGKEQADAWQKAYQHYVPLKGGPDEKAAKTGGGKGLKVQHKTKRALGHQVRKEGEWIVENIIADHERALMAAEKNTVGKHLLKMAMDVGIDSLMTVGKPEKRGVLRNQVSYEVLYKGRPIGSFDTLEGAQVFKASAPLTIGKAAKSADVTIRKSSDPSVVYMASPMPGPNEALVYVDGNVIRVQINDDLLAQAYGNMGSDALGVFFRTGQALNRWFSTVYTGYNPEFLVKNVVRDFTTGLANISGEEGALFAAKTAKNYFASFGALLRYARKGTADQWIRQYREDGGNTGAAYLSDLERLGADVQAEYAAYQGVLANLRKGSLKGAARAAGRRAFNATLRHIEALNEAGENAMRLALYRTAVEQGMTRNKAASLAKNTTVNFNRKGELGAQANALWLFFNAGVQGTASLAHAHFKGRHRKQAWAVSGAMAALGYSLALLAAGEDEDEYEKTPDHVKARNLVLPAGDGKQLTIPIPYGYGFFFTLGRGIADAQRTGKADDLPWKLAASFVGEFTPFSGAVAGDEPDMLQAGLFMLPTMGQIPMSVAVNRSSFGGPMYPENPSQRFEPDRLKMWRGTEGTWADNLAGALEGVGMDVSPETLKHMSRTFTGGAGNFVGSSVDAVALSARGATPEIREIPFVRGFYREEGVSDARARFWRYQAETRKAVEELKRATDAGDRGRAGEVLREKRELLAMGDVAGAFSEASGAARDRVQQIRLSDLPVAEKRAQIKKIEEREAELYDRFVRMFKERVSEGE